MRGPWQRKSSDADEASARVEAALEDSRRTYEQAVSRRCEVEDLVERLERQREQNHFAELFRKAIGGDE